MTSLRFPSIKCDVYVHSVKLCSHFQVTRETGTDIVSFYAVENHKDLSSFTFNKQEDQMFSHIFPDSAGSHKIKLQLFSFKSGFKAS